MDSAKSHYTLAVIPGDGIGPEIVQAALEILQQVADISGLTFQLTQVEAGAGAYRKYGDALPGSL